MRFDIWRQSSGAVTDQLLGRVGFTNHAIERFAERAALPPTPYQRVENIIRDLLRPEGLVTTERPSAGAEQLRAVDQLPTDGLAGGRSVSGAAGCERAHPGLGVELELSFERELSPVKRGDARQHLNGEVIAPPQRVEAHLLGVEILQRRPDSARPAATAASGLGVGITVSAV